MKSRKWFAEQKGFQEKNHQIKIIFSWSYDDMDGLDENFTHSLVVKKYVKLIKQKPIKMHPTTFLLAKKKLINILGKISLKPLIIPLTLN